MSIPLSVLWNRVGDQWLVSRTAAVLFSVAAILAVVVPTLMGFDVPHDTGIGSQILWGITGVLTVLGIFFIWSGMWRFWTRLDRSSRNARRIWFCILLIGFWYGAVFYFVFVYLRLHARKSLVPKTGEVL